MSDIGVLFGLRVLIVGLGKEGLALAQYFTRHGIAVAATDLRSAEQLGETVSTLQATGIHLTLGSHPVELLDKADILFVSPGVPLEAPLIQEARARKIPLSTESRLFCYLCPAQILAITGSSGKTTTTTLLGKILEADGKTTWVGGNIGRPLMEIVDQIKPTDMVVMELSSFQLEYFHARLNTGVNVNTLPAANPRQLADLLDNWSPPISALLNITPNHLDRHPSMKHYVKAKRAIINYQGKNGVVVMDLDNDMTRAIGHQLGNRVRWFSLEAHIPGGAGVFGNKLVLFNQAGHPDVLVDRQEIKLRGNHNLRNILAACLMAREAGVSKEAILQVIVSFSGVPHRLQLVRELNHIAYYNDSISTSPERVIAALRSFEEPIILLAGGRDKQLPWEEAARFILRSTRHVIVFGEAADIIIRAVNHVNPSKDAQATQLHRCDTLEQAVQLAAGLAQPGDVVLLSPGCASFDAFTNYMERGDRFKELVMQL